MAVDSVVVRLHVGVKRAGAGDRQLQTGSQGAGGGARPRRLLVLDGLETQYKTVPDVILED